LKCSLCNRNDVDAAVSPLCILCFSALKGGNIPLIDFRSFFSQGLERKLKDADILLSRLPDHYFLWYLKGHLEHELGELKKALRSISASISYKEDFGDAWIRLGLMYSDMHRSAESIESFEKGLRYPLIDSTNLVDAGISLQASDYPQLAARLLLRSLDLEPDDDRALVALGKIFSQLGELEEAKEVLDKALKLYPHNEEVLRGMAQIQLRTGDLDSAMDMYSRILDLHNRDFEALLAVAEIHLKKGELTRSIKAYKAVKDLDINISWSGVQKFIISALKNVVRGNREVRSYREDLKQEYENTNLFISEMEAKSQTSSGPAFLDDVENLVKVLENMKITLKEQVVQFEALLKRYKVDDSFHKHLESKLDDLRSSLSESRHFDAKQVSLELMPFLSDLRTVDTKNEAKIKAAVIKRLDELAEIGLGREDLRARLAEVDALEVAANLEGATFMLKEIEISLEEHWHEAGRKYHKDKMEEMGAVLERAKDNFDTSGLARLFESFDMTFKKGPLAVRDSYVEFLKRYEEDSASFHKRETDRAIREANYKLVILEKEGADISALKVEMDRIISLRDGKATPIDEHSAAAGLLAAVEEFEKKNRSSQIREALLRLDRLMGDLDLLGMDDEVARNVEPVRRVIERSLNNDNMKLADILTGELYDNVEKLLKENYQKDLEKVLDESTHEIARLGELGVDIDEWLEPLERTREVLEGSAEGTRMACVSDMTKVQNGLQDFYLNRLPHEIDRAIEGCRQIFAKGEALSIPFEHERRELGILANEAEDISSLEMLEGAHKFQLEIEASLSNLITERTKGEIINVRKDADDIINAGASQSDVMEIFSLLNRSEVLLERGSPFEAYLAAMSARKAFGDLERRFLSDLILESKARLESLMGIGSFFEVDVSAFRERFRVLDGKEGGDLHTALEEVQALLLETGFALTDGASSKAGQLESSMKETVSKAKHVLPQEDIMILKENLKTLRDQISEGRWEELVSSFGDANTLLDELIVKATKGLYLEKCSQLLEQSFMIRDERSTSLVGRVQKLAERIRGGDLANVDAELSELQKEVSSLRSFVHMQTIEGLLSELNELDDLSREVFRNIDDPEFTPVSERVSTDLRMLMDLTSALYTTTEISALSDFEERLTALKETVIETENRWRAKKRLKALETAKAYEMHTDDPLFQKDIRSLKELYEKGDHVRFFRTWERVEGKMERLKTVYRPDSGMVEEDKARQILVRPSLIKRTGEEGAGPMKGDEKGLGGIRKIGLDIAHKRRVMDAERERPEEVSEPEPPAVEEPVKAAEPPKGNDLVDVAKRIAGSRIEGLKRSRSKAVEDDDAKKPSPQAEAKDARGRKGKGDSLKALMDELMKIDTTIDMSLPKNDLIDLKAKLEEFFSRSPPEMRLKEAKAHYLKAASLMSDGKEKDAFEELKLSMSSSVKEGKLHKDLNKALKTIRKALDRLSNVGRKDLKAEGLYAEAMASFGSGDLVTCQSTLRTIRDELARSDDRRI